MHRCASLLAGVLCPAVFPDGFRLPDMCRIGKHNCAVGRALQSLHFKTVFHPGADSFARSAPVFVLPTC